MSKIQQTLTRFFLQYPDRPIVIAYSGGVDSQVLLHALASLSAKKVITQPLTVCHVNHGLSENALLWQQSAERLCAQLEIPLTVCQVHVKAQAQKSLEALARDARYEALKQSSAKNALIVTGHHSDDQSETFLLALKRGAGLKGLSAMRAELPLLMDVESGCEQENGDESNIKSSVKSERLLVRPLLSLTRDDITQYANHHELIWIEDESNTDVSFDRNFLRHEIMPLLQQRWPSISTTINRSAEHCDEAQQLLNELAQQDLNNALKSIDVLSVDFLCSLSKARFNNVLRYFLTQQHVLMPSAEQLKQVHAQLSAPADKTPEIKVGKFWLRRYKNGLYFTPSLEDISTWCVSLDEGHLINDYKLDIPDGLGQLKFSNTEFEPSESQKRLISTQKIIPPTDQQRVLIRFMHDNPRCLPHYRQQSRPLKKVLQELGLPPWQRKRVPFLYYDNELVAGLGYFVCQPYLPQANDKLIHVHWLDNNILG